LRFASIDIGSIAVLLLLPDVITGKGKLIYKKAEHPEN
jgi:hypothetical protein